MRAEHTKGEAFTPQSITITCESQVELDVLGSMFNYVPIVDVLESRGVDAEIISDAFIEAGATLEISKANWSGTLERTNK